MSLKSISVSDSQLSMIYAAATPLPRADRDAYFEMVAEKLRQCPDPGDADVYRLRARAAGAFHAPGDALLPQVPPP